MSTITTALRLRRYTMGAALILFPALLVAQAAVDPGDGDTAEEMYAAASQHVNLHVASALLLLISGVLMAPAVAGILHQARDRGAALANVAAVLAVLGGFGHAAIALYVLFTLSLAGGEPTQMVAYVDRLNASVPVNAVAFPLIFCFGLAVLTMAWSAWRAGLIGWWAPAVVTALVLAHVLLPDPPAATELVSMIVLTVVFGLLGWRILRMTDTQWTGVRPVETPIPAHA
ncbi:hypothetical protein [Paractinoplanes globisporus]|uniref:DUF4386 family protein n=1 Tax=Paractinoplanes globisporus TaxID=113565 RepID=A0ABW6W510_9ACTN|nr:hypothetical protein [Actinoplanes globisporus]